MSDLTGFSKYIPEVLQWIKIDRMHVRKHSYVLFCYALSRVIRLQKIFAKPWLKS